MITEPTYEELKDKVKELERQLAEYRLVQEALRQEKEKFKILIEESPFGISIIGKDGCYEYINPKFVDVFGYTLEDISTGKEWFEKAYPDSQQRHKAISTWITDLKKSKIGETRPRTFTVNCKDNSDKVIRFRPVSLGTGEQFIIYEDITDRVMAEKETLQREKVQAALETAGAVCHEMNQPMMAILGYSQLALMNIQENRSLYDKLLKIQEQIERMREITDKLMKITRYKTKDYASFGKIIDIDKCSI